MNKALKKLNNQDGVTMVLAIVFYLAVTLTCITLFHVTSGAIKQAANHRDNQQAEVLAASMSEVIQKQIIEGVQEIKSLEFDEGKPKDGSWLLEANNDVAGYILTYLGHGWSYYNDAQAFNANKDAATKVLTLEGLDKYNASGKISMYWTSDLDTETSYIYNNRKLYVTVTMQVGEASASRTSIFEMIGHDYLYADISNTMENQYFWWMYSGEMR